MTNRSFKFRSIIASVLATATLLIPAQIAVAAGGEKPTQPGRSTYTSFIIEGIAGDVQACITMTSTGSAHSESVETMLFMTNNSSDRVNVATALAVNSVRANGSTTATYNPGVPTRSGWKTSVKVGSPGVDTVTANFTIADKIVGTVSGQ